MNQGIHPMGQALETGDGWPAALPGAHPRQGLASPWDPQFSVARIIEAITRDPPLTAALHRLTGLWRTVLRDLDGRVLFESMAPGGSLRTTLEEAILRGVSLQRIDLRGADLRGARIVAPSDREWVYMDGADLSGAALSGAEIARANLIGADLSDARMPGASLRRVNAMDAALHRTDLSGAELSFVGMSGVHAMDLDLSACVMDSVAFNEARLVRADLSRSRILRFDHTGGFNRADLSYADLGCVEADGPVPFIQAKLLSANLADARLPGAVFIESLLDQCTMASAHLAASRFERASCEGVDAAGSDLRRASIVDANFDRANLESADLRGARIRRISTERAAVSGIRIDDEDAYLFAVSPSMAGRPAAPKRSGAMPMVTGPLQQAVPHRQACSLFAAEASS